MRSQVAYDDMIVARIFGSQLAPDTGELSVGRSTLTNNCTIPPGIVMLGDRRVNNAVIYV